MQPSHPVLIFLACLVLPGKSTSMKDYSTSSSALSMLLRSQGPKVDTSTLVKSLNTVAKGLESEDKKATELLKKTKSAKNGPCRQADLKMALSKGNHEKERNSNELTKTQAQKVSLKAKIDKAKANIKTTNTQLDEKQAKLKKMRKDKGLLKKGAASALRQVEAVISKTYLRESNAHNKGPSALEKKVNSLEELSKSLSFLQLYETSDEEKEENKEEADLLTQKHTPVMILKADKQAVVRASDATQRGFDEEEKKLIDLIEVDRKKLEVYDDELQDLQPAYADKVMQEGENQRSLTATKRGLKTDTDLMEAEGKKCNVIKENLAKQKKLRSAVSSDVKMAAKVLESMDTALFLTKDLQGLKRVAPSFLQISEDSHRQQLIHDASAPVMHAISLLQEGDGMGLEELVENYDSSMSGSAGPFDKVTNMISGLIASLKRQANEEVNQHQFCQDSLGKNRRDRIAKKNNIDTLTSTIRWSKMAIVRLDDDLTYLGGELARLKQLEDSEVKELEAENKRVNAELKEHKLAGEVITKATLILTQLCGAVLLQRGTDVSEPTLIQKHRQSSKVGSRFSQCEEASKFLKSATLGLAQLDKETKEDYLPAYTDVSKKISSDAKAAQVTRDTELKSTKSAKAQRASELASSNKDVKGAKKELALLETAKQELEHSCTHVETREEKMAKRKDEIDALKEALNVLNGEAVAAS